MRPREDLGHAKRLAGFLNSIMLCANNSARLRKTKDTTMQIGMIGIGKMGANMARRLMKQGHQCVVYARGQDAVQAMVKEVRHRLVFAGGFGRQIGRAQNRLVDGPGRRGHGKRRPANGRPAPRRQHPD